FLIPFTLIKKLNAYRRNRFFPWDMSVLSGQTSLLLEQGNPLPVVPRYTGFRLRHTLSIDLLRFCPSMLAARYIRSLDYVTARTPKLADKYHWPQPTQC